MVATDVIEGAGALAATVIRFRESRKPMEVTQCRQTSNI